MIIQTLDIYQILLGIYVLGVAALIVLGIYKKAFPVNDKIELLGVVSVVFLWPIILIGMFGYFLLAGILRIPNDFKYKNLLRETYDLNSQLKISRAELDKALDIWNQISTTEEIDQIQAELIKVLNSIKRLESKIKVNSKRLQKISISLGGISKKLPDPYANEFSVIGNSEVAQDATFFNLNYQLRKYSNGQIKLSLKEEDLTRHLLDIRPKLYAPSGDERSNDIQLRFRRVESDGEKEEWKSIFTNAFKKGIKAIDKNLQARVLGAILEILENPITAKGDTIKPLTSEFKGMWRYRIGDYRLVYLPKTDNRQVLFVEFASRGHIYH
jgi:mRNA interferase RelE/StbE